MSDRQIVIDGANVIRADHGLSPAESLLLCIQFCRNSLALPEVKCICTRTHTDSDAGIRSLQTQGFVDVAPAGYDKSNDDLYILDYAEKHQAFVISNDLYRDHMAENGGRYNPEWIRFFHVTFCLRRRPSGDSVEFDILNADKERIQSFWLGHCQAPPPVLAPMQQGGTVHGR